MRPPRKQVKTQSRIRGHLGEASKSEKCSPKEALLYRGRCSASLVRAPIPTPPTLQLLPPPPAVLTCPTRVLQPHTRHTALVVVPR